MQWHITLHHTLKSAHNLYYFFTTKRMCTYSSSPIGLKRLVSLGLLILHRCVPACITQSVKPNYQQIQSGWNVLLVVLCCVVLLEHSLHNMPYQTNISNNGRIAKSLLCSMCTILVLGSFMLPCLPYKLNNSCPHPTLLSSYLPPLPLIFVYVQVSVCCFVHPHPISLSKKYIQFILVVISKNIAHFT